MTGPIPINIPTGLRHHRDPDHPCRYFEEGTPVGAPINGIPCFGDGHYLCHECRHFDEPGKDARLEDSYGRWIRVYGITPARSGD